MKFGTGMKLDVFYTKETKEIVTRYCMAICGVYGIKGKMGISNEIANQNESLPLKKYTTYLLTITTGTSILKIH